MNKITKDEKKYWGARAEKYNNLNWVNKNNTLEDMLMFAGDTNGKKVLDLGTGTGKVLSLFKKHNPCGIYYGIDISNEMTSLIDKSLGFNIQTCAMEDMNIFQDNYFDVVTARMCMHHAEDIDKAFYEVKRVLKPNGIFIVCEGTPPDRHSVDFYTNMFKYKEDRHTFLLDDLTNHYIKAGYNNILSKTTVLEKMSLNNWIDNGGTPEENKKIIKELHYNAPDYVKKAYLMEEKDDDILMNWKFVVVCGSK